MDKVLFIGHYRNGNTGWTNGSYSYIRSLSSVGIEVVPRSFRLNKNINTVPKDILDLETNTALGSTICIQNVLPHHLVYDGRFKKNIAICYYEMMDSTCGWQNYINVMDELWTSSEYSKLCFQSMGVTIPIKVLPIGSSEEKFRESVDRIEHPELSHSYIFYTVGDMSRRKNLAAIIKAFHLAFRKGEPAKLLIKTFKYGMSGKDCALSLIRDANKIKESMKLYTDISSYQDEVVIGEDVSDSEINQIHNTGHCFVTASRGEAFCVPLFESICWGNDYIYGDTPTGFSVSHFDYTNRKNRVESRYEPCFGFDDTFHNIGSSREKWLEIDIIMLSKLMRQKYENQKERSVRSPSLIKGYSYQEIGSIAMEFLK